MPSRITEVRGLRDVRIRPLIADSPDVSAPSYGAPVDLPGAASITLTPQIESDSLLGDDRVLAVRADLTEYEVKLEHRRVSLDALKALFGGTVTSTATTERYDYAVTSPPYFRIDALIEQVIQGLQGLRLVLWKVRVTDAEMLASEQQSFGELSFTGRALPLEATDPAYNGLTVSMILSTQPIDLTQDV